jgi:hypothetical protein
MNPESVVTFIDTQARQIFAANAEKGFWEYPGWCAQADGSMQPFFVQLKKCEKIALMHSELSEALEGLRKDLPSDKIPGFTAEEEEMADLYIRLMDHAGGFKLRLGAAIVAKLAYNASRPHKHGKKF